MSEFDIQTESGTKQEEPSERSFLTVSQLFALLMAVVFIGASIKGHLELSSLGETPDAASIDKTLIVSGVSTYLIPLEPGGPEDPAVFIRSMSFALKGFGFVGLQFVGLLMLSMFLRRGGRNR